MRQLNFERASDEVVSINHDCVRLFLFVVSLKLHFVDEQTAIKLGTVSGYQPGDVLSTINHLVSSGVYVAMEIELPSRDSIINNARSLNSELSVENAIRSMQSLHGAQKNVVRMIGPGRTLAGCIGIEMPYRISESYVACCYRQSVILSGLAAHEKEWRKKWKNRLSLRPYPSARIAKWADTPLLFLVSFRSKNIKKWMNHLKKGGCSYVVC